jgi:GNAT superfamily N-acetyltransferase
METTFHVRKGRPEDVPAVLALIKELAEYERAPQEVTNTEEALLLDGFGPEAIYGLFVAENERGQIGGMAIYYEKYSTWKGRCLFLEDIIVSEKHRRKGIGEALFREVIREAKSRHSGRLEWQVLEWNEPAIRFYEKLGAGIDPEWLNGKFTYEQLQNFKDL